MNSATKMVMKAMVLRKAMVSNTVPSRGSACTVLHVNSFAYKYIA